MTHAEAVDQALDVAVDAITRRARALEGCDPEVAEMLFHLASRLDPSMLNGVALDLRSETLGVSQQDIEAALSRKKAVLG